jgi:hypothetical protein
LIEVVFFAFSRLQIENQNLHRVNTSLHEKNHFLSLKHAELQERINAEETKNEELQNKLELVMKENEMKDAQLSYLNRQIQDYRIKMALEKIKEKLYSQNRQKEREKAKNVKIEEEFEQNWLINESEVRISRSSSEIEQMAPEAEPQQSEEISPEKGKRRPRKKRVSQKIVPVQLEEEEEFRFRMAEDRELREECGRRARKNTLTESMDLIPEDEHEYYESVESPKKSQISAKL